MAHLAWRKTHKTWRVVWFDATVGARKSAACSKRAHTQAWDAAGWAGARRALYHNGATNKKLRLGLLAAYVALEQQKHAQALANTGPVGLLQTPIMVLVAQTQQALDTAVEARANVGGRAGVAAGAAIVKREAMARFLTYARAVGLETTGDVDYRALCGFKTWLLTAPNKKTGGALNPHTINKFLRAIKAWLRQWQDPMGQDNYWALTDRAIARALTAIPTPAALPKRFTVAQIQTLWRITQDRDNTAQTGRSVQRNGKTHIQKARNPVAVSPIILLLLLTGCRRQEALDLRWADVALDTGVITYRSQKTGQMRRLPLVDPKYPVSPAFLGLLRRWRAAAPTAVYVLPCNNKTRTRPVWPKLAWEHAQRLLTATGIYPERPKIKTLRSNWVSYMVSLGVPVAVVAQWAGHSPEVLTKHYFAYTPTSPGGTLDTAFGLGLALG